MIRSKSIFSPNSRYELKCAKLDKPKCKLKLAPSGACQPWGLGWWILDEVVGRSAALERAHGIDAIGILYLPCIETTKGCKKAFNVQETGVEHRPACHFHLLRSPELLLGFFRRYVEQLTTHDQFYSPPHSITGSALVGVAREWAAVSLGYCKEASAGKAPHQHH